MEADAQAGGRDGEQVHFRIVFDSYSGAKVTAGDKVRGQLCVATIGGQGGSFMIRSQSYLPFEHVTPIGTRILSAQSGSLFASVSRIWAHCLSGSWFSTKSAWPLHDGVRELIGQNVIRDVGFGPRLPL